MAVSQDQVDAILAHCRALLDASGQLARIGRARGQRAVLALRAWDGPHADVFRERAKEEGADTETYSQHLRWEADRWAQIWADAVNHENARRRNLAVVALKAERGFGERQWDRVVGDDSDDLVRSLVSVSAPTDGNRYAPTGQLETYE